MDISNWVEISPGIFVAPDAGSQFGGDVGQAIAQTVSTAVASGAQTAGEYYSSNPSAPLASNLNIDSYSSSGSSGASGYDGSAALAAAQQQANVARAGLSRRRRLLGYRRSADRAARRSLSVLQGGGATSNAGTARATKAKKKKGRTKSNVRLGSVQASPGSSLNISV